MKNSNLTIEHQCPQCGAPATLEETDRLFACEFCRVKSYLTQKDYFRYLFPQAASASKQLVFFPYWRFKGMLFSSTPDQIRHRFVDTSYQAVESPYFPISVGLRSQALKLRFVLPETQGHFLKPTLPIEEVMRSLTKRFATSLSDPVLHRAHIGETLSMIYSPFYIDDKIYDAILNAPVSVSLPDDFDLNGLPGGRPDWRLRFIPALCPDCGWDLNGSRDSLVLICRNCSSVWRASGNRLQKLKFAYIRAEGNNITYLPFWRIRADVSEIKLRSYADLIKIANLPKVIRKFFNDLDFRFWSPAFKVRPEIFLRLGRQMTLLQPGKNLVPALPDAALHSVTLPILEAVESLKIILASLIKSRNLLLSKLGDINVTPKSCLLVFIPFNDHHHELIQPMFQLGIRKSHLSTARNL